jgi:hypothetical protein
LFIYLLTEVRGGQFGKNYKETTSTNDDKRKTTTKKYYDHHHHHQANMDLGHLLTRSARTLPEALGLIYLQPKLKW